MTPGLSPSNWPNVDAPEREISSLLMIVTGCASSLVVLASGEAVITSVGALSGSAVALNGKASEVPSRSAVLLMYLDV